MNLDLKFFNLINGLVGKYKWLDKSGIFFAKYFIYILVGFIFLFYIFINNFNFAFNLIISGFLALFFAKVINLFYKRKRPSQVNVGKNLIKPWHNPSFPSRHTSFAFGFSFFVLLYNLPLGILLIVFSAIIGISRIFVGVHWPTDILGGIVMGLISALIIQFLFL